MAKGGWIIKFNDVEAERCYAIAFDYDMWEYTVNNREKKKLPNGLSSIKIEIGEDWDLEKNKKKFKNNWKKIAPSCVWYSGRPKDNGYVFGKPKRHLDRIFKNYFDEIGIKGNVKKFRDTYASYSLTCGMPLQNLKENLGHSYISTTQIYLQAVPRIKSEEIKTLFNGWK